MSSVSYEHRFLRAIGQSRALQECTDNCCQSVPACNEQYVDQIHTYNHVFWVLFTLSFLPPMIMVSKGVVALGHLRWVLLPLFHSN